jgi:hypothetical protein
LREIGFLLSTAHRGRDIGDLTLNALWGALLSGQRAGRRVRVTADGRMSAADRAWWKLMALHAEFARVRELPALAIVLRVAAGERAPADRAELNQLLSGLVLADRLLETTRARGRRRRRRIRTSGQAPRASVSR